MSFSTQIPLKSQSMKLWKKMRVFKGDVSDEHKRPKPPKDRRPSRKLEGTQEVLGKRAAFHKHQIFSPKKPRKFRPVFH